MSTPLGPPEPENGTAGGERWWPSRFGADDQIGMLNHVTDAKRREALALVRDGTLYDLGRILDEHVPVFPGRSFHQTLVTTAHHINDRSQGSEPDGLGVNKVNWVTETIATTMQLGTHVDSLAHLQVGERVYNGWTMAELAETWGVNRLGAETIPQVVTCGWLIDVPAVRGTGALGRGDVINLADVEAALDGAQPAPGDAVLFHTGWGERWSAPPEYLDGEPGPGLALAQWLAERGVALTGCDTWSYGPFPPEDPDRPFVVPQTLNAQHGVFVVENLDTAALAADGVSRFALIVTHPRLRGASGAWTSPIALV